MENYIKCIAVGLQDTGKTSYITASSVTKLLQKETLSPQSNLEPIESSLMNKTLEEINLYFLQRVLSEENGNQSTTAKRLGISRTTLWRMLQKVSLPD